MSRAFLTSCPFQSKRSAWILSQPSWPMVASRTDSKSPAVVMESAPPMHRGVVPFACRVSRSGVALARLGDPRALKNAPVEHQEVRAVSGQGGRVLGPVDRDRGQHVLGELRLDVVGEEGGDVADGAGVAPRGDVAADEALPDVGRVPARDARGEGDVGLGASAAGHRDLVHGGLGVPRLVLVDEGVEGG